MPQATSVRTRRRRLLSLPAIMRLDAAPSSMVAPSKTLFDGLKNEEPCCCAMTIVVRDGGAESPNRIGNGTHSNSHSRLQLGHAAARSVRRDDGQRLQLLQSGPRGVVGDLADHRVAVRPVIRGARALGASAGVPVGEGGAGEKSSAERGGGVIMPQDDEDQHRSRVTCFQRIRACVYEEVRSDAASRPPDHAADHDGAVAFPVRVDGRPGRAGALRHRRRVAPAVEAPLDEEAALVAIVLARTRGLRGLAHEGGALG